LPPVQIDDLAAVEERVLLRSELDFLAAPLGNPGFGAELDRPGSVLSKRMLSSRIGSLIVPKADAASGTMTVKCD